MKTEFETAAFAWSVFKLTVANAMEDIFLKEEHAEQARIARKVELMQIRDQFYPSSEQSIRDTIADHYKHKLGKPSYDRTVTNAVNGNDQAGHIWWHDLMPKASADLLEPIARNA